MFDFCSNMWLIKSIGVMVFPNLWSFLRKSLRLFGNGNLFLFDILLLKISVEIPQVNLFLMFVNSLGIFIAKVDLVMECRTI